MSGDEVIGRAVPSDTRTLAPDAWYDVLGFRYRGRPGEQVAVRFAGTVTKTKGAIRFQRKANTDARPVWLSASRFHIHLSEGNNR